MPQHEVPRPFLKWVGGKRQLTEQLMAFAPPQFGTYFEPFVGGGALFFALYRAGRIQKAHLSDLNQELIDTYTAVRDHTNAVLERLETYRHTEKFFYKLRKVNPKRQQLANRAARMIFLNKTCYNGLYRVNRNGKFNAPFGRYKNPNYRDPDNLYAVSSALQNVGLACEPFEAILSRVRPNDFVYFDPPYVPLSATANFTGYQASGFSYEDQVRLRNVCRQLNEMGVHFMLSNSDTEIVRDLYAEFSLNEVQARRAINSDPSKRGKLSELIMTNLAETV